MREHVPGLESIDNLVAQQIDAGRPPFALGNDAPEWSKALADTAYFRLAWSLAPPTDSAYERFLGAVDRGVEIFAETDAQAKHLAYDMKRQIREAPLFAGLADRSHDLLLNDLGEDAVLNRRVLCAAAIANHAPRSARKDAAHKLTIDLSDTSAASLIDTVPEAVASVVEDYLLMAHTGPVDKVFEPLGEGQTFADFRKATTAGGTRCIFYHHGYALERPWLVANGTLLDITTTRRTKPSLHKTLRTLAGFVIVDTADEFGIENVAWYHAPSGQLYEQPIDSFFAELGATESPKALREQFAVADARKHIKKPSF